MKETTANNYQYWPLFGHLRAKCFKLQRLCPYWLRTRDCLWTPLGQSPRRPDIGPWFALDLWSLKPNSWIGSGHYQTRDLCHFSLHMENNHNKSTVYVWLASSHCSENVLQTQFSKLKNYTLKQLLEVSYQMSVLGLTSHSTHNRSFQRRVFWGNRLHWYWQPSNKKAIH